MFSKCLLILIYCVCWVVVVVFGTGLHQVVMVTLLLGHGLPDSYTCGLWWLVCVVSVFCCDEFGSGGYLWLGVSRCCCSTSGKCLECLWLYGILLVQSVKWTVYLSRTGFPSLDDYGRFSAVVWLRSFLDLANLFWLKVLLVPVGVWSLGWLVGACRLWGQFEILYGYVNGALRFKLCRLWWDFYFALLCPNGCLGSVILLFKPAWFMLLVLWTLYSVSVFAFRAVSTKSCGVLFVFGPKLAILEFWRAGE